MRLQRFLCFLVGCFIFSVACLATFGSDQRKVNVRTEKDDIEFRIGDELVGRYHKAPHVAKPFLWPVLAPGNVPITRAWPMEKGRPGESTDHVHQKSVWFCHGDVIPEGVELKHKIKGVDGIDFWSEHAGHGVIRCVWVDKPADSGAMATRNEWLSADGTKIMDENRTISLHDLRSARLFVIEIDLHASVCPVTFADTKEGSFGVRVHDALRVQKGNGRIENAEGKVGESQCWGQKSAWCDYSGTIGDQTVGITVFDDPANPHPACWHVRGYGLMAANPFGRAKSGFPAMRGRSDVVRLEKGEHLKLRYGLLLHSGNAKDGKVAEHFSTFVGLPTNMPRR